MIQVTPADSDVGESRLHITGIHEDTSNKASSGLPPLEPQLSQKHMHLYCRMYTYVHDAS
jgi:hypothetical protein